MGDGSDGSRITSLNVWQSCLEQLRHPDCREVLVKELNL